VQSDELVISPRWAGGTESKNTSHSYAPVAPERPEGLLFCVDFTDLSGGQFSPFTRTARTVQILPERPPPHGGFSRGCRTGRGRLSSNQKPPAPSATP